MRPSDVYAKFKEMFPEKLKGDRIISFKSFKERTADRKAKGIKIRIDGREAYKFEYYDKNNWVLEEIPVKDF